MSQCYFLFFLAVYADSIVPQNPNITLVENPGIIIGPTFFLLAVYADGIVPQNPNITLVENPGIIIGPTFFLLAVYADGIVPQNPNITLVENPGIIIGPTFFLLAVNADGIVPQNPNITLVENPGIILGPMFFVFSMGIESHQYSAKGHFYNIGIDSEDSWAVGNTWKMHRLGTIMKMLNHERVSIALLTTVLPIFKVALVIKVAPHNFILMLFILPIHSEQNLNLKSQVAF